MMSPQVLSLIMVLLAVSLLSHTDGHSLDQTLGTLQKDVQGLKSRVTALEQFHKPSGIGKVSFLARLSSEITPSSNSVIKFPLVIQNYGSAYNSSTGKFTAPVSGTYLFHVSAAARAQIQVDIIMDGDLLATAWGGSGSGDVQGSNMAVVHMRKGQRVWARFMRGDVRVISGGYTQFTGTLLHKD